MDAFYGSPALYLGIIAGSLQLVGYLIYIRNSDIEPNPTTWLMFAYGTMLLTFLEWDHSATLPELLLPLVCSAMAVVVAARCWVRARRRNPARFWPQEWWPDDWRDRIAFQTDVGLTVLYLSAAILATSRWISEDTREVAVTVFLLAANLTTFTAFFPLIRSVAENATQERPLPWAVWACAYTLLGLTTFTTQGTVWSSLMVYPALNAILHGSVAVLARRSRRQRHADILAAMPSPAPVPPGERQDVLRLSHGLVALQSGGIITLMLVVLGTALWISREHNKLAVEASQRLIQNEIEAIRNSTYTLVRDYSLWDEGFRAVLEDDRAWLYSSIGSSVTDLGTFDLAILVPDGRRNFGWVAGSPPEGQADLLPPEILDAILGLLATDTISVGTRTLLAEFDGAPWVFAVSRMMPVDGMPEGFTRDELPVQIHGRNLREEVPTMMGRDLLQTEIFLSDTVHRGEASVPLVDYAGRTLAYMTWAEPSPGASILRHAAIPLALALSAATAISATSSVYAVRSARRLERALVAARAADRSRTEFLSNVSHELRTPMNGVLGATQLLETTELDPEQRELVSLLMTSATAQMSLISDLIDVSRIDSGNRKLENLPFAPIGVLGEVTDMMKVAATRKGISLDVNWIGLDRLTVRGDAQALRQIMTNLVGNAVKFTDRGSVDVTATAVPRDERVLLTVTVADTGPGIPDSAIAHIFERFYQVDGSMTRRTEGTGLGLAISQKLALAMGAEIQVSSEVGIGSTFIFSAWLEEAEGRVEVSDAA